MPDMIKFSYIPKNELYIHGDSHPGQASVDFAVSRDSLTLPHSSRPGGDDEHVLVLDFADNSRGKKQQSDG
jgi:DEAD/DEAH box helicase domain-containing protein